MKARNVAPHKNDDEDDDDDNRWPHGHLSTDSTIAKSSILNSNAFLCHFFV